MMADISIIIPVFNEAENIKEAIERIESEVTVPHIIYIVYDMDEDTTVPIVNKYFCDNNNVKLLKNKYEHGGLNAIKTGFESSIGTYAVVTMADLSDPPTDIINMYNKAEQENADIVCASRYMKGGKQIGGSRLKGILSRIAGLTLHYFAGLPTHDITNNFRLYRLSFIHSQNIDSNGGFGLALELTVKAHVQGHTICEIPTVWVDRENGRSNFKLFSWLGNYLKWYFYAFTAKKQRMVKYE